MSEPTNEELLRTFELALGTPAEMEEVHDLKRTTQRIRSAVLDRMTSVSSEHPAYAAGLRRAVEIVKAGGGVAEIEAEIKR